MQWEDVGIVLSARKHAEQYLIVEILTAEHGLHAGVVRGVKKYLPLCQPGNVLNCSWKARLEEHLGNYTLEQHEALGARIMLHADKLSALNAATSLLKHTLPEREPHPELYHRFYHFIHSMISSEHWMAEYIFLELEILQRLGYGLQLHECADTGSDDDLVYVSPKSGNAVCAASGAPYKERLLDLPDFLQPKTAKNQVSRAEVVDGMALTGYFLQKWIFEPHGKQVPEARGRWFDSMKISG